MRGNESFRYKNSPSFQHFFFQVKQIYKRKNYTVSRTVSCPILSHLTTSPLISSHLVSHLISSRLISSHLISSHLISSHLISSLLISSHLISSHPVCHPTRCSEVHHRTRLLRLPLGHRFRSRVLPHLPQLTQLPLPRALVAVVPH